VIGEKIQTAFNRQNNAELFSAYLYLSMSAYFESINLKGFAKWMRVQAQEEMVHAMKFFTHVVGRGGRVLLQAIEASATEWKSPLVVFEAAYAHEQKVTDLINSLVDLALEEKDHAGNAFLQWFVTEQIEEGASADDVVQKLKRVGDSPQGLFLLDQEMAQRVFAMPAATGEGGAA